MSSNTTTAPHAQTTERAIAYTTCAAPVAVGALAPFLDNAATFTVVAAYGGTAGFLIANYLNKLPARILDQIPVSDILDAHESPLFTSTVTTGFALAAGVIGGPEATDAIMAGILNPPSIPGIISTGFWAACALPVIKLRKVLGRKKHRAATPRAAQTVTHLAGNPDVEEIHRLWGQHISHPQHGSHKGQILTVRTIGPNRWTGTITAPLGAPVTVTKEVVSSVYQRRADWITFKPGAHEGERHITVNLTPPPELDPTTLQGAWKKWVARSGGLMAGTHLENVQPDPNTGGEVALIVAGEDLDRLRHPDRADLVGALRVKNPLLVSYEPRQNPREAVIRKMTRNPLQQGTPFPGPKALLPSNGGYFRIGVAVSGRPVRAQLLDPKLGARHLIVTGVTGSGKGGVLQLIALASHLAGAVILYGDPKGSSNPTIEDMAAYSGLGEDGAMGTLRIVRALIEHRIEETARLKQKNFDPSVMPHVVVIIDEVSSLTGEEAEHRKEAAAVIDLVARKGRSLGVSLVLANQILQLEQLGGKSSIRDNVVGSGGVIMLRSDSSQRTLIDLPPGMEGCNPADIPATWSGEENDTLVYTDDTKLADPESTFGLGYFMTTDGICAMGRSDNLEDATPYIDTERVQIPTDWPGWEDRHEIAAMAGQQDDDDSGPGATTLFSDIGLGLAKPAASADEKILSTLKDVSDPLGITINYVHKDQIAALTKLNPSTLENTLTKLLKTKQIHRQAKDGKDVRGMYGLGPAPEQTPEA